MSGYPPSHQLFPGTPQFSNCSLLNTTPILQAGTSASPGYSRCGPLWQGYVIPQGGDSAPQIFLSLQYRGQGPTSLGASRVPSVLPGKKSVM